VYLVIGLICMGTEAGFSTFSTLDKVLSSLPN
jgi:hypothetical protein